MDTFKFNKTSSEGTIKRTLKRNGYSAKRIASFLRGWNQLNEFRGNNGKE